MAVRFRSPAPNIYLLIMTKKLSILALCLLFVACSAAKDNSQITKNENNIYEVKSDTWKHLIPEHLEVMFDVATVEPDVESDKPLCGENSYMVKVTEHTIGGYEGCLEEMEDHANGLQLYYFDANVVMDGKNVSVELDLSAEPCGPVNATDEEIAECDIRVEEARKAFDPIDAIEAILEIYEDHIKSS